jgi:hypothetical protein
MSCFLPKATKNKDTVLIEPFCPYSLEVPLKNSDMEAKQKIQGGNGQLQEPIFDEKGSSYFLLLCAVRGIVEKHGGSMKIDEKENTFVLGIPSESWSKSSVQETLLMIFPLFSPLIRVPRFHQVIIPRRTFWE